MSDRVRLALAVVAGLVLLPVLVFLPAGTLRWLEGWLLTALLVLGGLTLLVVVGRRQPGLLARRLRTGAGTKAWDRVIVPLLKLCYCAQVVVAGLSLRRGWPALPREVALPAGLLLAGAGWALFTWCMALNPHFETTVRIQTERAHTTIEAGPYARLRHPGYLGFALLALGTSLLLAAPWGFLPAGALIALLVLRTALEDRTLRAELPGYAEYAARVRWRLLPGVW